MSRPGYTDEFETRWHAGDIVVELESCVDQKVLILGVVRQHDEHGELVPPRPIYHCAIEVEDVQASDDWGLYFREDQLCSVDVAPVLAMVNHLGADLDTLLCDRDPCKECGEYKSGFVTYEELGEILKEYKSDVDELYELLWQCNTI